MTGDVFYRAQINRTTLKIIDIESGLKRTIVQDQLKLIRLRNVSPAFTGDMKILDTDPHLLHICWQHPEATATLKADLRRHSFTVLQGNGEDEEVLMSFDAPTSGRH